MGKSGSKRKGDLKSALASLQSRVQAQQRATLAERADQVKGKVVRRKHAGEGSQKNTPKVQQRPIRPFLSEWDNILMIGEGNFSFALSLVQHHRIPGHRITATTYDNEEQLLQKYPESEDNLRLLRSHGVTVLLSVDARALHKSKHLLAQSKRLRGFSAVVWNFPHAGAGIQDQDRNIHVNQQMMLGFFNSVAPFLSKTRGDLPSDESTGEEDDESTGKKSRKTVRPCGGRVFITMRDSVPYTHWEVPQLAKHPPPGHSVYQQVRSFAFDPDVYPGYEHRRTLGGHHSVIWTKPQEDNISGRPMELSLCRTWEFVLRN